MVEKFSMQKDKDAFQRRIQQLKESDVSSTTFDDFKKIIKSELDSVMAFRKTLAVTINEIRDKAEEQLNLGKKQNYPEDNPYLIAANLLADAMNIMVEQMAWGDLQMDLLEMEREKLYSLVNKLVKENARVQIIKEERERDKQAFEMIKDWLIKQRDDLRQEREMLIKTHFIRKEEFDELKSRIENLSNDGVDSEVINKLKENVSEIQNMMSSFREIRALVYELRNEIDSIKNELNEIKSLGEIATKKSEVKDVTHKSVVDIPFETFDKTIENLVDSTATQKQIPSKTDVEVWVKPQSEEKKKFDDEVYSAIYEFVSKNKGVKTSDITKYVSEKLGIKKNTVSFKIYNMRRKGYVKKRGDLWYTT